MTEIAYKDGTGAPGTAQFNPELGRRAAALVRALALCNEDFAAIGAIDEAAPAGDTDPAGLNGRLQRLAQQQTSLAIAIGDMATDINSLLTAFSTPATGLPSFDFAAANDCTIVPFSQNTAVAHTVVAAPGAGLKAKLYGLILTAPADNVLTIGGGVDPLPLGIYGAGLFLPPMAGGKPLMEAQANTALTLTLGSASLVHGWLYTKVSA